MGCLQRYRRSSLPSWNALPLAWCGQVGILERLWRPTGRTDEATRRFWSRAIALFDQSKAVCASTTC